MIFKTECFANILWIVWYDYMRMWESLLGVEHDVYHRVIYFSLYLDYEKLYEVVDLWWCCWYWCEYAKCRLSMVILYMLNVNIWYGDFMCWIMLLNSYMQFDDDSCGACMYQRCLFWWWIMLLNYYMQTMVLLMMNACFQNEGDLGYIYIQWWWCWWVCCWTCVWCVICSCMSLRMFTSSGVIWILCIQWFYDVFVASWGDNLLLMMVSCPFRSRV